MQHPQFTLFPVPFPSPSRISPRSWPGITPVSTQTLLAALAHNHENWHIYFDQRGFQNHATHYLLALWSLGADEHVLTAAYKQECECQVPAFESPEPITVQNFKDHLGDAEYYSAYRNFFTEVVRAKGIALAVEEYVFDRGMNFDSQRDADTQPAMLSRFFDGLIHPIIHAGYGFEFGLPGMVVEGLASTAIHKPTPSVVITPALFDAVGKTEPDSSNVHALSVLARILRDNQFEPKEGQERFGVFISAMQNHGEALKRYASEWTIDLSSPGELERKIEELVWATTVIYGIGGWSKAAEFNADFFHMHLVTPSLFLSSIAPALKRSSQELLLRGYFVVCLGWWVGRGRPGFDIPGFFADATARPLSLGPLPTPSEHVLPSRSSPQAVTPNPWLPLLETTLVHTDDHLPKLQRALVHYGALYGARPAGQPDFAGTELPGADRLDGTLFIRVAGLSAERMGRVREGQEPSSRVWDRRGFYKK